MMKMKMAVGKVLCAVGVVASATALGFVAARETRAGVWYAGGITTADARDCTLDTSFLGDGEWTAEMFGDAGDAKEDAQKYRHEKRKIKAGAKLPFHMAPGGGFIVKFANNPASAAAFLHGNDGNGSH